MSNAIQEAKQRIRAAELALQTAKDNLAFAKLSKPEKRVAIAKDVITQIRMGKIHVTKGMYLSSVDVEKNEDDEVVALNSCNACALGSVFACAVTKPALKLNLNSVLGSYDASDDYKMRSQLAEVFSEDQLWLIEIAFELDDFNAVDEEEYSDRAKRAINFGEKYSSDERRLIKIMENVIKNKGTFKP